MVRGWGVAILVWVAMGCTKVSRLSGLATIDGVSLLSSWCSDEHYSGGECPRDPAAKHADITSTLNPCLPHDGCVDVGGSGTACLSAVHMHCLVHH